MQVPARRDFRGDPIYSFRAKQGNGDSGNEMGHGNDDGMTTSISWTIAEYADSAQDGGRDASADEHLEPIADEPK